MGVGSLLLVDFLQLLIPRVIKLAVDDLTRYQASSSRLLVYAGMVLPSTSRLAHPSVKTIPKPPSLFMIISNHDPLSYSSSIFSSQS